MNRNLILLASIILFLFGLRMIHNSILIIDHPKAKEVYMKNKDDKIISIFYEVKNTFGEQHTYIFKTQDSIILKSISHPKK